MSPELERSERMSVEARWAAYPWWQEGLVAAFLFLVAGPVAAIWLRNEFPTVPWIPLAGLGLFWIIAAQGLYKRARGHVGRYQCPECGATIGPSKGFAFPGKREAPSECAHCGVHLTYPKQE